MVQGKAYPPLMQFLRPQRPPLPVKRTHVAPTIGRFVKKGNNHNLGKCALSGTSARHSVGCNLLPGTGEILDLGCGYGYISYMLKLTSNERIITGVDYDEKKISLARHGYLKDSAITFINADITEYLITPKDGFLLGDVLHYLPYDKQKSLLQDCIRNLKPGGVILIREGNSDKQRRHKYTKFTEFFSTRIIRFNKTQDGTGKLYFTSAQSLAEIAEEYGLVFEMIGQKKITSNVFFIMHMPFESGISVF